MPRSSTGAGAARASAPRAPQRFASSTASVSAPSAGIPRMSSGTSLGPAAKDVGTMSVDVTSPQNLIRTVGEDLANTGSMFDGLRSILFGVNNEGGIPLISDAAHVLGKGSDALFNKDVGFFGKDNIVGDVVRTVPNSLAVVGNAVGGIGELGKRITLGPLSARDIELLDKQLAEIPDSPEKRKLVAEANADIGPFGLGHQKKYEFVKAWRTEQQRSGKFDPDLYPELSQFTAAPTLASSLDNLLGIAAVTARPAERGSAGWKKASGMDRLDEIEAVHNGAVYSKGLIGAASEKNTPMEELALERWKSGLWTRDQALDWLSSIAAAGFSHDPAVEIAAQVLLSADVALGSAASATSRLASASMKLSKAAEAGLALGRTGQQLAAKVESSTMLIKSIADKAGVTLSAEAAERIQRVAHLATRAEAEKLKQPIPHIALMSDEGWETVRASEKGLGNIPLEEFKTMVVESMEQGGRSRRGNFLAKLGQNERVSAEMQRLGTKLYSPMQEQAFGKGAKLVRYMIDPLHAIGGGPRTINKKSLEVTSEVTVRAYASALGEMANAQLLEDFRQMDLYDDVVRAQATAGGNLGRQVIARFHVAASLAQKRIRELVHADVNQLVDDLQKEQPADYATLLKREIIAVRELGFDEMGKKMLAKRLFTTFGKKTEEEWLQFLDGKSVDYMSNLHFMTFGRATESFLEAGKAAAMAVGKKAANKMKLDRLFLMNRQTLTSLGAEGIIGRLDGAVGDTAAQLAEVKAAQELYPQLQVVTINMARLEDSIGRFRQYLEHLVREGALPMQLTDAEIDKLPDALREWILTHKGVFTFGVRPPEDKLMGLVYDAQGVLIAGYNPWVDQVAAITAGYRPTLGMRTNAVGMPLIGQKVGKAIDFMQAGANTLKARVTSDMVLSAASSRFVAKAVQEIPGLSEREAQKMFGGILDMAGVHAVTPRGLSQKNMWLAVKDFIPDSIRVQMNVSGNGPREVMNILLDAFEGDLRFVGLTQKLTGRAKSKLGIALGTNFMGELSENIYQKVKFRYNPVFQLQERIEPLVLNGQRGVHVAFGTKTTAADRRAAAQMRRLRDSGVIRSSDVEQAEYAAMGMTGSDILSGLDRATGGSFRAQFMDVAGSKRLNLMRAYEDNMGRAMRESTNAANPGRWDEYVAYYSGEAGFPLSDGEVAMRILAGNQAANISLPGVINSIDDVLPAFEKVIRQASLWMPSDIGRLHPLRLDEMVDLIGLSRVGDEHIIRSVPELIRALGDSQSGVTMERVKELLSAHGAHSTYIDRVERALRFDYHGFWRTMDERFRLGDDLEAFRDIFNQLADAKGMTPIEYLSQVFDVTQTGKFQVGNMQDIFAVLRPKGKVGTESEFVDQMSTIFAAHLDPSARNTLYGQFEPSLMPTPPSGKWDLATAEQEFPMTEPPFQSSYTAESGRVVPFQVNNAIGDNLRHAGADVQEEFFGIVGPARRELPLARVQNVDIKAVPENVAALTIARLHDSKQIVVVGGRKAWVPDPAERALYWQKRVMDDEKGTYANRARNATTHPGWQPGVPFVRSSPELDMWHEMMHAVERSVEQRIAEHADAVAQARAAGTIPPVDPGDAEIKAFILRYSTSPARGYISGYSVSLTQGAHVMLGEAFAELGALALSPEGRRLFDEALATGVLHKGVQLPQSVIDDAVATKTFAGLPISDADLEDMVRTGMSPDVPLTAEVEVAVYEMRALMKKTGHWVEGANTAAKTGPVVSPADFQAAIRRRVVDGDMTPLPPDFERGVQEFTKWMKTILKGGLKNDPKSAALLAKLDILPTDAAVPYNATHQLLVDTLAHQQRKAVDDAFRLHYFARDRSFFERSINHPFFGLYPASYMYGKILPELVRFVAKEPFGIRTGVGAESFTHVMQSLATQRELDPEFDEMMEKTGNAQLTWLMGYMMPSPAWDVGSAFPSYMRSFARQGLENQRRADAGLPPNPINFREPIEKTADYLSPGRPLMQMVGPAGELGKILNINQPAKPGTTSAPQAQADQSAPGQLAPVLDDAIEQLRQLFAR